MIYVYPAVIQPDDNTLMVTFPDIDNCFTSGVDYADAIESAEDVLSMMLCDREDNKEDIPAATSPGSIKLADDQILILVKADTSAYRKIYSSHAVRKTVTVPAWMVTRAETEHLSLSQVLQEALREKLEA